jgi:hypothetical protein
MKQTGQGKNAQSGERERERERTKKYMKIQKNEETVMQEKSNGIERLDGE